MALIDKEFPKKKNRFKAVFYGDPKVGKTTAAASFPAPFIIDSEDGTEKDEYQESIKARGGKSFFTTDFNEVMTCVKELLQDPRHYKTLVIDSISEIYFNLCTHYAAKLARESKDATSDGMEFQRHKSKADMDMRKLLNLMKRLDMNVILVAQAKDKWQGDKVIGTTFDSFKKSDYLSDLVIEIKKQGSARVGYVKGSREKTAFPEDSNFPFSYEEIVRRYGKELIEKEAVPEVLATEEQITEINRLISLLKIPEDEIEKRLSKAKANTLEDISSKNLQLIIDFYSNKLSPST